MEKCAKFVRRYELGTGHKLRSRGHTEGQSRMCGTAMYKLWDRVGCVEQLGTNCRTAYRLLDWPQSLGQDTNCDTGYKVWDSVQRAGPCTESGTMYKVWDSMQIVTPCTKSGTVYKVWACTNLGQGTNCGTA